MVSRNCLLIVVAGLLVVGLPMAQAQGAVGAPGTGIAPLVYVSNTFGGKILRVTWKAGDGTPTTPSVETVYAETGSRYEGLVVGPDGLLYAFDPTAGKIVRINLADIPPTAETVHMASVNGPPNAPQGGWFTNSGDLIVTEQEPDTGDPNAGLVFRFPAIASEGIPTAVPLLILSDFGSMGLTFAGEGLTQSEFGNLLIVDRGNGIVWVLPNDPMTGTFQIDDLAPLIENLDQPVGVARSNFRGDIFVATLFDGLVRFDSQGGSPTPCGDLDNLDRPFFIQNAPDDRIYLATTSKQLNQNLQFRPDGRPGPFFIPQLEAKLWEFEPLYSFDDINNVWQFDGCNSILVQELSGPDWYPSLTGVAVPFTNIAISKDGFTGEGVFSFGDHAYKLELTEGTLDSPCTATVDAHEVPPSCLEEIISGIPDLNDPDDPVVANVIIYASEDGRGWVYDVTGSNGTCLPPEEVFYKHAISIFPAKYLSNPRMVACEFDSVEDLCAYIFDPDAPPPCEVGELLSYYPFDGIFEGDAFMSQVRPAFSQYFLIEAEVAANTVAGDFCGLQNPATNPDPTLYGFDNFLDPALLDIAAFQDALPVFGILDTEATNLPLKFRIANSDAGGTCNSGPYVSNAEVLLAIARVRKPDPANPGSFLKTFEPVDVVSAGNSGEEDPTIFSKPTGPSKNYHKNIKFTGYQEGIYQLVFIALTDNFIADVRYIRLEP